MDSNGFNVNDFESLIDGGKYTLGPSQQQQQFGIDKLLDGTPFLLLIFLKLEMTHCGQICGLSMD